MWVRGKWVCAATVGVVLRLLGCGGSTDDAGFDGPKADAGTDGSSVCEPAATRTCVGPGACSGGQVCANDGSGWSECDCGTSGSGGLGGAGGSGGATGGNGGATGGSGGATGGTGGTLVVPDGLVGYWKLDDGSGLTAADSSGLGNSGALVNGPTWTTGHVGGALEFDGKDDYVGAGTSLSLSLATVTVTAWILPTEYADGNGNGGIVVSQEGKYELSVSELGMQFAAANTTPGWQWQTSTYAPPLNQWTHVAWSYGDQSGEFRIYADGIKVQTLTGNGAIGDYLPNLNEFWIGGRQAGYEQYFIGAIDEVRVYDRVLTDGEVASIYSASK